MERQALRQVDKISMRILNVSPRVTYPPTSGGRIRVYNLLTRLAVRHEIRQFSQTRTRDVRRPNFAGEAVLVPGYREFRYRHWFGTTLNEAMENTGFGMAPLCGYTLGWSRPALLAEWVEWADVVVVEFPWQYAYCRSLVRGKPLVLGTHNVQIEKLESGGSVLTSGWRAWIAALERHAVLDADLILAVSERDRQGFVRRYGADAEKIVVVPNGADTRRYFPADEVERADLRRRLGLPAGPLIIFPAPHRQSPILEGMKWVRRVSRQIRECTFLITGAVEGNQAKREGNLLFTGFVDDYPAHLRSADCLFCPIQIGGGTKLKLIEGAAAGLPIVALAESVRGTTFRAGEHLVVAEDNTGAMAEALRTLLADREKSRRIGLAAREHVLGEYDWDLIADVMEGALARVVR